MTKAKVIRFADLRRLLKGLGYKEELTEKAYVFLRSKKDTLLFRRYADDDTVRSGDVLSTRQYLHLRGFLDESEFDSFFGSVDKSA